MVCRVTVLEKPDMSPLLVLSLVVWCAGKYLVFLPTVMLVFFLVFFFFCK